MKIEELEVFNLKGAIRGMRNPLDSHHLSDSKTDFTVTGDFTIGENDLKLAKKLIKAGKDHRKFMRQIFISFDLTAPEYFWKQYHTYKVSTTENSTSQMHTLGKRLLTVEDFEIPNNTALLKNGDEKFWFKEFEESLDSINKLIKEWQVSKDPKTWKKIVMLMPQSFLYKKTCTMTYESAYAMCQARENHKLDEWKWFTRELKTGCPYLEYFLFEEKDKKIVEIS